MHMPALLRRVASPIIGRSDDASVGVRAGQLLGGAGFGSEKAVDAFVVAVADLAGGAVVATVDGADVELLAAHATSVQVALI
jgi:hypothetical protein